MNEQKPTTTENSKENEQMLREKEEIISLIAEKNPLSDEVKKYLRGETDISSLYPYEDQLAQKPDYDVHIALVTDLLHSYTAIYKDKTFYNKVASYQLLIGGSRFLYDEAKHKYAYIATKVRRLYHAFEAEHHDIQHLLKFYSLLYEPYHSEELTKKLDECAEKTFVRRLTENRQEVLSAFRAADAAGRSLALKILQKDAGRNKSEILSYSDDSSEIVRKTFLDVLRRQKGWEKETLNFLSSKKAKERETAIRVLADRDLDKYKPSLAEALAKEKTDQLRTLLQNLLEADTASILALQDRIKKIYMTGRKYCLAWAYETPFSEVHKKNGLPADETYLQAILLCYYMNSSDMSAFSRIGPSLYTSMIYDAADNAAPLTAKLDETEFSVYVNELFDKWLALGADAKKRWVLFVCAAHGGAEIIKKLQYLIGDWTKHYRSIVASDAMYALALNPDPEALFIVDSISRKFRSRRVRTAAEGAFQYASKHLGITAEELADRIVPDLGFDENMERRFDYGTRSFTVTITPALETEIFDDNGKRRKNLPPTGRRDDPEKAGNSYAAFKDMKKQMRRIVNNQKIRLDTALSVKRYWNAETWKKFFVENPIMHQFATGLIWGVYKGVKLVQTFRYMEDGSFNTEKEEEFPFPKNRKIGIVHPAELAPQSLKAWKTQLTDYEITQPIEQLSRPVYYATAEEADKKITERFGGTVLDGVIFNRAMLNMGWTQGVVMDADCPDYYYREDMEAHLIAELRCSNGYVFGTEENITVFDLEFNRNMGEIPLRFYSEIIMQITRILSGSRERDPDWRQKTFELQQEIL